MKNRHIRVKIYEFEDQEKKSWIREIINRRLEGLPHQPYHCGDKIIWKNY